MTPGLDSAMVEALLLATEGVKQAYEAAANAGHGDVVARIRIAQWQLIAAMASAARRVTVSEELPS